jgi:hypothetical protein
MIGGHRDKRNALAKEHRVAGNEKRTSAFLDGGDESGLEFIGPSRIIAQGLRPRVRAA